MDFSPSPLPQARSLSLPRSNIPQRLSYNRIKNRVEGRNQNISTLLAGYLGLTDGTIPDSVKFPAIVMNIYSDNVYAIPACYDADKAWKIAFAYDLYTEPVPGFEDYSAYKSNYYSSMRDTESVDLTVARLLKNGRTTFHTLVPGIDLGPQLFWAINKDNTPAAQAEASRDTWQAYLDEANK